MNARRRRFPALLLAFVPLAAAGASQEPPPTFKRDVEVVTVDVVVTDKAGNPITGLAREDFTVLDEGTPQALVNFDVVNPPDEEPEAPATGTVRPRSARPIARASWRKSSAKWPAPARR